MMLDSFHSTRNCIADWRNKFAADIKCAIIFYFIHTVLRLYGLYYASVTAHRENVWITTSRLLFIGHMNVINGK